jgi:hypothetical protein
MKRGLFTLGVILNAVTFASGVEDRELVLADGKRYTVSLIDSQPIKFRSAKVRFLGGSLNIESRHGLVTCFWAVEFELARNTSFAITVRSPLVPTYQENLGAEGPGEVEHHLLGTAQSDRFCMWREGGDTSYVPFDFTFRDRKSGKEFTFRQWVWIDPWTRSYFKSMEEMREAKP